MIKLLLTGLLAFAASTAAADKTFFTKQPCSDWESMLKTPATYKEQMLFTGTGIQFSATDGRPYQGGMFFFVNQDTGTWTMVSVYGDGMACMVANGKDFAPYSGEQPEFPQEQKDSF
jgi:hypothetical protein